MSISVLLMFSQMLVGDCYPKLGHVMFEPLNEAVKNISNSRELKQEPIHSYDNGFKRQNGEEENIKSPLTMDQIFRRSGDQNSYLTIDQIFRKSKNREPPITINRRKSGDREFLPMKKIFGRSFNQKLLFSSKSEEQGGKDDVIKRYQNALKQYGYEFDETKCKVINSHQRVICGYNKNYGEIPKEHPIIQMANGCRVRGDRIECGYTRRPPAARMLLKNSRNLARNIKQPAKKMKLSVTIDESSDLISREIRFSKPILKLSTTSTTGFKTTNSNVTQNFDKSNETFSKSSSQIPRSQTGSSPKFDPDFKINKSFLNSSSEQSRSLNYINKYENSLPTVQESTSKFSQQFSITQSQSALVDTKLSKSSSQMSSTLKDQVKKISVAEENLSSLIFTKIKNNFSITGNHETITTLTNKKVTSPIPHEQTTISFNDLKDENSSKVIRYPQKDSLIESADEKVTMPVLYEQVTFSNPTNDILSTQGDKTIIARNNDDTIDTLSNNFEGCVFCPKKKKLRTMEATSKAPKNVLRYVLKLMIALCVTGVTQSSQDKYCPLISKIVQSTIRKKNSILLSGNNAI